MELRATVDEAVAADADSMDVAREAADTTEETAPKIHKVDEALADTTVEQAAGPGTTARHRIMEERKQVPTHNKTHTKGAMGANIAGHMVMM